jgi:Na+/melibiose symporter-like transporter
MNGTVQNNAVQVKRLDPLGFKVFAGIIMMSTTEGLGSALGQSWGTVYLNDYAGLGRMAPILGATVMFAFSLFDVINDPIEGWIMDRSKVTRFGKYKPFIIISIILLTVSNIGIFNFPPSATSSFGLAAAYLVFFSLLRDIGASWYAPNLLYRTITLDSVQRGKLLIGPRVWSMVVAMVMAGIMVIVNAVNKSVGNMHDAWGITVTVLLVITAAISLCGIAMVKEKHHFVKEKEVRVKFTDIFVLVRENKALRTKILSELFLGFIFTCLFAAALPYIKWGLCVDLTTGKVNTGLFGTYSLIASSMMILPLLGGTAIATPLMKKFGSPLRFHRFLLLVEAGGGALLFILQIIGVLSQSPYLFFLCMLIRTFGIGCNFIPDETLKIECMDYQIFKNGKDRSAMCNACNKLITKIQASLAGAIGSIPAIIIGYEVDSVTDTYIGDLAGLPILRLWLIMQMGLVPFLFGLAGWFILKRYPITNEVRAEMRLALNKD